MNFRFGIRLIAHYDNTSVSRQQFDCLMSRSKEEHFLKYNAFLIDNQLSLIPSHEFHSFGEGLIVHYNHANTEDL